MAQERKPLTQVTGTRDLDVYVPTPVTSPGGVISQLRQHVKNSEELRIKIAEGHKKPPWDQLSKEVNNNRNNLIEIYHDVINPNTGMPYENGLLPALILINDKNYQSIAVAGLLGMARIREVDLTDYLKNNYSASTIAETGIIRANEILPLISFLNSKKLIPEGESRTIDDNPIVWRSEHAQDRASYHSVLNERDEAIRILDKEIKRLTNLKEADSKAIKAAQAILLYRKSLIKGDLAGLEQALIAQQTYDLVNVNRLKSMARNCIKSCLSPTTTGTLSQRTQLLNLAREIMRG